MASTPANPKVRVKGAARPRNTTVVVIDPFAGISGEGKYVETVCACPSIVKLVRIAGTPASSNKPMGVCQLKPCASGGTGHTVFAADGTIAAAPVGTVTRSDFVAPPELKEASPEYSAPIVAIPVPPNR